MFGLAFVTLIGLIYAIEPDKIIDAMSEIVLDLKKRNWRGKSLEN